MNNLNLTFAIIDDDPADIEIFRRYLEDIDDWNVKLLTFNNPAQAEKELPLCVWDFLFIDYRLGAWTGLELLRKLRDIAVEKPIIILTGQGSEEVAVEAMKSGATDYLVKDHLSPVNLRRAVLNALEVTHLRRQVENQQKALIDAERQRVMLESVGAACHHFSQPLTALFGSLQLLLRKDKLDEAETRLMLQQCLGAAEKMKDLLHKFQRIREYRTIPYLLDRNILDIEDMESEDLLKENPKASEMDTGEDDLHKKSA